MKSLRASQPSDVGARQDPREVPNQNASCVWKEDEDGIWQTSCGQEFVFIDSGPKENQMRFCCYCGAGLKSDKSSDMR